MTKTICIANIKGGVGKTTIVHNLSHALSLKGKKILMLDLDMQGNLSDRSNNGQQRNSVYQLLTHTDINTEQCIYQSGIPNVDIIPSQINIGEIGRALEQRGTSKRLYILKERLGEISNKYDYIIMDTHPVLDYLFVSAMIASDYYIIPVVPSIDSVKGINLTRRFVIDIKKTNPNIKELGILINSMDNRTNTSKKIVASLEQNIGDILFKTRIPHSTHINQAALNYVTTFQLKKNSICNTSFLELSNEIMKRMI